MIIVSQKLAFDHLWKRKQKVYYIKFQHKLIGFKLDENHNREPSAGKERIALTKNWSSKFYCATEEGDLIYADWISEKVSDEKGDK